eukprot:TRINITY_DN22755_c0_g1_i2.p1 TRINITY_DN22755_c0_g1~~TRINITY_DN22755_c0_g1_i2.p1  ORF type:complete len:538 (+),score=100.08 TRINITY_DN22755_c0_g1_i2:69-1682(+)
MGSSNGSAAAAGAAAHDAVRAQPPAVPQPPLGAMGQTADGGAESKTLCRQLLAGRCASAAQTLGSRGKGAALDGAYCTLRQQWAAQQRAMQVLAETAQRLEVQLLAARAELERLRRAASSDREGSVSSEAVSQQCAESQGASAAGTTRAGSTEPGAEEEFSSVSGLCQDPSGAAGALQGSDGSPGPSGSEADGGCRGLRTAPEHWGIMPAAVSCRAPPEPGRPQQPQCPAAAGAARAGEPRASGDLLERARAAAARAFLAATRPHEAALRPVLLGQQLRAAAAELWALPAVEQHCRAATVLAEWAARGGLTVLLERDARATAATEVLLRRPAPVRLGPDGILRLQDADGEWKSKSQWRRKYKGNRMWNKVLHRSRRQTEHAVTVHRRRSKKAQQAFRINAIAYCIASYARNKWAIVCRGTAIGWIPMAQYRARCWFWEMCALGSDRGSIHGFVTLDIFVNASSDLQDFKDNLRASPDDWAAKSELMHRAEACQCIFDYFRIQSLDMARDAIRNWVAADTRCRSLRRILSIPPSMAAR